MNCKNCGNLLTKDDKFCPKCGTKTGINKQEEIALEPSKNKRKVLIIFIVLAVIITTIVGTIFYMQSNREEKDTLDGIWWWSEKCYYEIEGNIINANRVDLPEINSKLNITSQTEDTIIASPERSTDISHTYKIMSNSIIRGEGVGNELILIRYNERLDISEIETSEFHSCEWCNDYKQADMVISDGEEKVYLCSDCCNVFLDNAMQN